MNAPSLTGSDSFRARIQRSESDRAILTCAIYSLLTLLTFARRLADGVAMSNDHVFFPSLAILLPAIAFEAWTAVSFRAALRRGVLIRPWRFLLNACLSITVAVLPLAILHFWSPRGMYAALSAPVLLLTPITIILSVLRLQPLTTLCLGIAGALFHAALTLHTIHSENLPRDQYPVLFTYAALLALTGGAGMLVTRAARAHVAESVAEVLAREQVAVRLAGIERDLEVARQIQTGLLPARPPSFPGFDIAGMNRPADQTGGDYYDWQELPDGRLLAVVADVTGHGIGPALVMAVCRAYSRATAPLDPSPASLMARLNALLVADEIGGGRFVTLAMSVLDRAGHVELVSAGHGPTLLFHAATRAVDQFGGDGLPLAIVGEQDYGPSRTLTMLPGDVLVMLTDGVMEWQNKAGEQFGTERLADTVAASAHLPAAEIVERLHAAVLAHAGGARQNDDVTIVAIRRTA